MRRPLLVVGTVLVVLAVAGFWMIARTAALHERHSAACEAKGGIYLPQYKSKSLCLRQDVVIKL